MLREIVEVVDVFLTDVAIKLIKKPMCSCCRYSSLCIREKEFIRIPKGNFSLQKGDRVEIGVEEKKTIIASIVMFLIPACIFILSLFLYRNRAELVNFFLAIGITLIYYLIVRLLLKKRGTYFHIKIIRKL